MTRDLPPESGGRVSEMLSWHVGPSLETVFPRDLEHQTRCARAGRSPPWTKHAHVGPRCGRGSGRRSWERRQHPRSSVWMGETRGRHQQEARLPHVARGSHQRRTPRSVEHAFRMHMRCRLNSILLPPSNNAATHACDADKTPSRSIGARVEPPCSFVATETTFRSTSSYFANLQFRRNASQRPRRGVSRLQIADLRAHFACSYPHFVESRKPCVRSCPRIRRSQGGGSIRSESGRSCGVC